LIKKMKNKFIIIILLVASINILPQSKVYIGANGIYSSPIASLSDRIKGAAGGNLYLGVMTSDEWTWGGKLEYVKYSKTQDGLERRVKSDVTGTVQEYSFPLINLQMELTTMSLMAEAKYRLINAGNFSADLSSGFGFAYWKFIRGGYRDSLRIDPAGDGNLVLVEVLNVPALEQEDWSGIANVGIEFNYFITAPLSFNISANYKLLIGELWPALNLNIENVSGMQFLDIRGGFRIHL
jgi:hypothetical protein